MEQYATIKETTLVGRGGERKKKKKKSKEKRERENHSCWYSTICRNLNMSRKLKGNKMLPERETNYIYISVLTLKMCIHYFQKN